MTVAVCEYSESDGAGDVRLVGQAAIGTARVAAAAACPLHGNRRTGKYSSPRQPTARHRKDPARQLSSDAAKPKLSILFVSNFGDRRRGSSQNVSW
jgi:hypothetical protein